MAEKTEPVTRTDRFILFFQLDGLCNALRLGVQAGQQPGTASLALLRKFRNDLLSNIQGVPTAGLPEIEEVADALDILALAEVMRTTIMAFLTPEELTEGKKAVGFGRE